MDGAPNEFLLHVLASVAVDVSGSGYVRPGNVRVAVFDLWRQAARRFGDNLKTAGDGIEDEPVVPELLIGHAFDEALREADILGDIEQRRRSRLLRRHE